MQYIVIGCIFFGEILMIYAEQLGAKLYGISGYTFGHSFLLTLAPLLAGAVLLVFGYMLGLKHHQNIWTVTAISFGTILLAEPLFNYFYLGYLPDASETVGVLLGVAGIIAVTFF